MLAVCCGNRASADDAVTITAETTQSTYFSEVEATYELNVSSDQAINGTLTWRLSALHRTLASGDVAVKTDAAAPQAVTLRLRMPPIKDGVIEKLVLFAGLSLANDPEPVATFQRDFWVFASDPFVDRMQWLEQLELKLYDPGGATAKIYKEAEIPFEEIRSVAGLQAIQSGITIAAEGVHRGAVTEVLVSLASAGGRVLWFAPEDVEVELPGSVGFVGKRPKKILLSGSDMIEQLDKRLDPLVWADAAKSKSINLNVVARRGRTNLETVEPGQGWPWLQVDYSDPAGKLILCGLGLVDCWDASPTPRYMLARLLEELDDTDEPIAETEQ